MIATPYNERVQGDLSNNQNTPTTILLKRGSNLVTGKTTNSPLDRDFLTFVISDGFLVTAILLIDYQWGDGNQIAANYGNSYFALREGSSFPTLLSETDFIISTLIDDKFIFNNSEINQDLLDRGGLSGNTRDAKPTEQPSILNEGTYSIWYQETAATTTYTFDIQLVDKEFDLQRWANNQGGFWDAQKWVVGDFNGNVGNNLSDLGKVFGFAVEANIDVHTLT